MANTPDQQLPKAVADKYDLKILSVGTYDLPGIGVVDLSKVDLKTAGKIAKKTPYLVAKPAPIKSKTTAA
ncbi:hypothetical protein KHS38_11840 [Mucilaginibacter sp. Bleaf8]|uniref:hypothetical protein n=1 Tax=Mucilaginibacter sp. Bleaf8 TaxID=2834430 RepID=UPI001BD0EFA6|nr:hypothetical protein [Mucilaginibacter sp. Bleaf8]MBS7565097.1 hypothetical protein [Mucilaginibacter sp. Bleaf8]